MYQEQINLMRTITRGLNRIKAINLHYAKLVSVQVKRAELRLNKNDRKAYKAQGSRMKSTRWLVDNNFIEDSSAVDMLAKGTLVESAWVIRHKHIVKLLKVSLAQGFDINVISRNKNGAMVSISHPSLKTNVTRHLRWQGKQLTGHAPYGVNAIVSYSTDKPTASESFLAAA